MVAREAAELLRSRYGATRVLAFGSLAEGLHPSEHFAALGRLLILSPGFEFDLVDLDACPPGFQAVILAQGVAL